VGADPATTHAVTGRLAFGDVESVTERADQFRHLFQKWNYLMNSSNRLTLQHAYLAIYFYYLIHING
jgi:hypothetical protein